MFLWNKAKKTLKIIAKQPGVYTESSLMCRRLVVAENTHCFVPLAKYVFVR